MLNITLTEEQMISLIDQLPAEKRRKLVDHLVFDDWIDSEEGREMLQKSENDFAAGKVHTLEDVKKMNLQ